MNKIYLLHVSSVSGFGDRLPSNLAVGSVWAVVWVDSVAPLKGLIA